MMIIDSRTRNMIDVIGSDTPVYWREKGGKNIIFESSVFDLVLYINDFNNKFSEDGFACVGDFFSMVKGKRFCSIYNVSDGWDACELWEMWGYSMLIDVSISITDDDHNDKFIFEYEFVPEPREMET